MAISGGNGKRFVSQLILAVRPAQQYKVTLVDSEGLHKDSLAEFTVAGVKSGDALLFNNNGRMISKNSLPYQGANLLLHGEEDCIACRDITLTRQAYPTDRDGYTAYYVEPCGSSACLSIDNGVKTVRIEVSREISLAFGGKKLFSLREGNLYVEPPTVYVMTDADTPVWGYEIRIGENAMDIGERFVNGTASVKLNEVTGRALERYGTYAVSLYRNGKFIKQAEFCYTPDFKAEGYTGEPVWLDGSGKHEERTFRIGRIDDWDIEMEEGGVLYPDARFYTIECRPDCGTIKGKLRHNEGTRTIFECAFEMPVSAFSYTLTNGEQENTKRTMDVAALTEERWWVFLECSGDYKQDEYVLRVSSVNGIEQEAEFKLSAQGCGNFDLSAFADTLKHCVLPAKIVLCHKKSNQTATLFIAEKQADMKWQPVVSKDKLYVYEKDLSKPLKIVRFGAERYEFELKAADGQSSPIKNKKGNTINMIAFPVNDVLREGIYVVREETEKSDDDIFGFEQQEPVFPDNSKNTFLVDAEKIDQIGTVRDFISVLVREVVRAGMTNDIGDGQALKALNQLSDLAGEELCEEDYEKLIALAFFVRSIGSDQKKAQIRRCMRVMAQTVLNGKDRMEIVRALVRVNAPEEIFDLCLSEYGLLLFERGQRDTYELAELLEANCPELALMLLTGADVPTGAVFGRAKLREIIGGEAMMEMISVPDAADEDEKRRVMREFIREQDGEKIQIRVTSKLTGDMDDIQKMFELERNKIRLNLSKKPEDGIYFDHIKYVDQYLNWYFGCHDADLQMSADKKKRMVSVMTRENNAISQAFRILKKTQDAAVRYEKAISARCRGHESGSTNWENPPMYFYLQGLAAYIVNLPERDCPGEIDRYSAVRFMLEAADIAPRISKRDLVLAAVYQYLIRKEERLCR